MVERLNGKSDTKRDQGKHSAGHFKKAFGHHLLQHQTVKPEQDQRLYNRIKVYQEQVVDTMIGQKRADGIYQQSDPT